MVVGVPQAAWARPGVLEDEDVPVHVVLDDAGILDGQLASVALQIGDCNEKLQRMVRGQAVSPTRSAP